MLGSTHNVLTDSKHLLLQFRDTLFQTGEDQLPSLVSATDLRTFPAMLPRGFEVMSPMTRTEVSSFVLVLVLVLLGF